MTNETSEHVALSIQGREIHYAYRMVSIDAIRFYRKNPRIATILAEHPGEITDQIIDERLWDRSETHRLYGRIKKDGGLIHPILVYKDEVLEGNTRLCCYRHLSRETKDEKWRHIKCHLILDDLSQDEIYRLLCTEHIEGKIEWEAYEKANLYRKMKEDEGMTLQQISGLVGESTTAVSFKIKAHKLMVESGVVEKHKYSHFEQLVSNTEIQKIKSQDRDIEEKLVELIKDGKIRNAVDVRKVPDIYKDKAARKRLLEEKRDIQEVYHDLKARAPMTVSPFMKDIESLINRVRDLRRDERDALTKSKRDLVKIKELVRELVMLCREIGIKIHIPKDMKGN